MIPGLPPKMCDFSAVVLLAQRVRRASDDREVIGSNPTGIDSPTHYLCTGMYQIADIFVIHASKLCIGKISGKIYMVTDANVDETSQIPR